MVAIQRQKSYDVRPCKLAKKTGADGHILRRSFDC